MALRLPPLLPTLLAPLRPRLAASISTPPLALRPFSTTLPLSARSRRKPYNRFTAAAAKVTKEAALARRAVLTTERKATLVDPVLGTDTATTDLLSHFPNAPPSVDAVRATGASFTEDASRLNHFLKADELPAFLEEARKLMTPVTTTSSRDITAGIIDEELLAQERQKRHENAVEAIRRIVALGNGSSADLTRENKQMCIEMFGRHNTDGALPRDPGAAAVSNKTERAGPDTGSSEVQAAILTVKIRTLAKELEEKGRKDKHNKKGLRLLVHRRQKILKYLKRKERGGIRYRNVMEALGLDDAAVHEEVFL